MASSASRYAPTPMAARTTGTANAASALGNDLTLFFIDRGEHPRRSFQGRDSSGITQWGWWRRYRLRTLNSFTHKPVSCDVLMLVSSDASQ